MQFCEKLNLLMDITKTSNSALARYVSLDASYISRLRNGKRLTPRNNDITKSMSSYFARNCKEEYQKKAIVDALNLNFFPNDLAVLTDSIVDWLLSQDAASTSVSHFLGGLILKKEAIVYHLPKNKKSSHTYDDNLGIFYGVEGKRQAVLYFLHDVLSLKSPKTLLLFSDEDTSWMTEDPSFSCHWAALMVQILTQGHNIKIIHTISRDLDEMLSAINQWMPLYMAGTIEPYFYPKKRDGIFKRTMFIVPSVSAVVSSSVGNQAAQAANMLFHDPTAVSSFEEEFLKYLAMCKPLMKIFTSKNRAACLSTITEFEREQRKALIKTESLSLLTMPVEILSQILARNGLNEAEFIEYHKERIKNFQQLLKNHTFTEIIDLPAPREILQGQVKIAFYDILNENTAYYTPAEYLLHLQNILRLLRSCENYHIHFIRGSIDNQYSVYVKEDLGVIVAKSDLPPVVLAIGESNMTASFWDFLKSMISERSFENPDKKAVINKIDRYINQIN